MALPELVARRTFAHDFQLVDRIWCRFCLLEVCDQFCKNYGNRKRKRFSKLTLDGKRGWKLSIGWHLDFPTTLWTGDEQDGWLICCCCCCRSIDQLLDTFPAASVAT
jgi:hypothetical protein